MAQIVIETAAYKAKFGSEPRGNNVWNLKVHSWGGAETVVVRKGTLTDSKAEAIKVCGGAKRVCRIEILPEH